MDAERARKKAATDAEKALKKEALDAERAEKREIAAEKKAAKGEEKQQKALEKKANKEEKERAAAEKKERGTKRKRVDDTHLDDDENTVPPSLPYTPDTPTAEKRPRPLPRPKPKPSYLAAIRTAEETLVAALLPPIPGAFGGVLTNYAPVIDPSLLGPLGVCPPWVWEDGSGENR